MKEEAKKVVADAITHGVGAMRGTRHIDTSDFHKSLRVPDRVSVEPDSPYFYEDTASLEVFFEGKKRPNDVREFCISEGWIRKQMRMRNGKLKKERGKVLTLKMRGKVEVRRII